MSEKRISEGGRLTYYLPSDRHAVYRIYDHAGKLLYIGCSWNPAERVACHRQAKPWRHRIAGWTEEWHPDLVTARRAERRAIAVEGAEFNVWGTPLFAERTNVWRSRSSSSPYDITVVW
jgi:hypothetical protein